MGKRPSFFFELNRILMPGIINIEPIKGYRNFSEAFKYGKKFSSGPCLASISFAESDKNLLYGVSVGRRTSKKAVIRNKIKRLLRESLRIWLLEKTETSLKTVILSWREAPQHPALIKLDEVKPKVDQILNNAVDYYTKTPAVKSETTGNSINKSI